MSYGRSVNSNVPNGHVGMGVFNENALAYLIGIYSGCIDSGQDIRKTMSNYPPIEATVEEGRDTGGRKQIWHDVSLSLFLS